MSSNVDHSRPVRMDTTSSLHCMNSFSFPANGCFWENHRLTLRESLLDGFWKDASSRALIRSSSLRKVISDAGSHPLQLGIPYSSSFFLSSAMMTCRGLRSSAGSRSCLTSSALDSRRQCKPLAASSASSRSNSVSRLTMLACRSSSVLECT